METSADLPGLLNHLDTCMERSRTHRTTHGSSSEFKFKMLHLYRDHWQKYSNFPNRKSKESFWKYTLCQNYSWSHKIQTIGLTSESNIVYSCNKQFWFPGTNAGFHDIVWVKCIIFHSFIFIKITLWLCYIFISSTTRIELAAISPLHAWLQGRIQNGQFIPGRQCI